MNTPTITRRRPPAGGPHPRARGPGRDCLYEGVHEKTGKRYSVKVTTIVGEVGGSGPPRPFATLVVESKDPTLQ